MKNMKIICTGCGGYGVLCVRDRKTECESCGGLGYQEGIPWNQWRPRIDTLWMLYEMDGAQQNTDHLWEDQDDGSVALCAICGEPQDGPNSYLRCHVNH
jgi:hypothetical protein